MNIPPATLHAMPRGRPPKPMPDDGLAEPLRELSQQIRALQAEARELETRRNQLVRDAADAGWTHARIADVTGLTRGRIGQIAPRSD